LNRAPGRVGGWFWGKIGFELAFKGSNIGFDWVLIGFEMALFGFELGLVFSKNAVNIEQNWVRFAKNSFFWQNHPDLTVLDDGEPTATRRRGGWKWVDDSPRRPLPDGMLICACSARIPDL
jgi:hypothetical protein